MNITTMKEFSAAQQGYKFIDDVLKEFGEQFKKEFGGFDSIVSIDHDYDDITGDIYIETTTRLCSCCYPDERDYYEFPINYLWADDWVQLEKNRRAEQKAAAERFKAEQEAKRKAEHEEKRYQQFLEMKKEYEGED